MNDLRDCFTWNISHRQRSKRRAREIAQAAARIRAKRLGPYRWMFRNRVIGTRKMLKIAAALS